MVRLGVVEADHNQCPGDFMCIFLWVVIISIRGNIRTIQKGSEAQKLLEIRTYGNLRRPNCGKPKLELVQSKHDVQLRL